MCLTAMHQDSNIQEGNSQERTNLVGNMRHRVYRQVRICLCTFLESTKLATHGFVSQVHPSGQCVQFKSFKFSGILVKSKPWLTSRSRTTVVFIDNLSRDIKYVVVHS